MSFLKLSPEKQFAADRWKTKKQITYKELCKIHRKEHEPPHNPVFFTPNPLIFAQQQIYIK